MPTDKKATSYRLSDEAREAISHLAGLWGCTETAVIQTAVLTLRQWWDAQPPPVVVPPAPEPEQPMKKRGRPRKQPPA